MAVSVSQPPLCRSVNFRLERFTRPGPAILATDRDRAVITRLNWLGHDDDPDRNYVGERDALITDSKLIDLLFVEQIARF